MDPQCTVHFWMGFLFKFTLFLYIWNTKVTKPILIQVLGYKLDGLISVDVKIFYFKNFIKKIKKLYLKKN